MAVFCTIEIHERGSVRTVIINDTDVNFRGLVYSSENLEVALNFDGMEPIVITFPSQADRSSFVTNLQAGIDGATNFSLSNAGPVATTTTTTTVP